MFLDMIMRIHCKHERRKVFLGRNLVGHFIHASIHLALFLDAKSNKYPENRIE